MSNFYQALGAVLDLITEDEPREIVLVEKPRPRRREVVIVEERRYNEVYPLIRRESFDSNKAEKAAKYFEANRAVNLDDLLRCLKFMNFDNGRAELCNALRRPISKMNYFERMEIADTFTWKSSVPSFITA